MKLQEVLTKSIQFFKDKNFDSPRLEAELLISHALKIERIGLYLKYDQPLNTQEIDLCRSLIRRRSLGEPVAYITEEKGFFGLNFKVKQGVLVPRPETEAIVEEALKFIKLNSLATPNILDIGGGSGCISLSILKNCSDATVTCIESEKVAQEVIIENANRLEIQERLNLQCCRAEDFNPPVEKIFDIIVSNPPYIDVDDIRIQKSVKDFEPAAALFAPNNGLEYLKNWSKQFQRYLKHPGLIMFEIGLDQGEEMKTYFQQFNIFKQVSVQKDLSGLDRFIKGTT